MTNQNNYFHLNLPLFIARRYLFSTRTKNFINIISIISVIVITIITAALIIVLSVFNGLEDLLRSLNSSFDPEIKIEAAEGKTFETEESLIQKIRSVPGVEIVTEVIEDYAYVRYRDENQPVTLKGVSDNFLEQHRLDNSIIDGELALRKDGINYAIIGSGVQNTLSVAMGDKMHALNIFYVKNVRGTLNPSELYSRKAILPGAVFSIVQSFDENYVIVPLDFARELLNSGNKRTSLEIKLKSGSNISVVEENIQRVIGDKFSVLNHEEQHKDLYKLLKMEKLFAFLALSLLLAIGSINIFFSLMMLALDKKKDISVLSAMGADGTLIRKIYLFEGTLIGFLGTFLGLTLGAILCWVQMNYGIVSMGMETSVTEGYPVKVIASDLAYVLIVMFSITFLISYRPATVAARFASVENL